MRWLRRRLVCLMQGHDWNSYHIEERIVWDDGQLQTAVMHGMVCDRCGRLGG